MGTHNGTLVRQEKELIEAALAETSGRISGQSGAATKLGLPARTLDSKIKRSTRKPDLIGASMFLPLQASRSFAVLHLVAFVQVDSYSPRMTGNRGDREFLTGSDVNAENPFCLISALVFIYGLIVKTV